MKSGIIRRIDDLGRVVIPRELRKHLNIYVGDSLEFTIDGDKLYLEKYIENQEYEKHINGLIERIKYDEEMLHGKITEEKEKVISLLKEANLVLANRSKE